MASRESPGSSKDQNHRLIIPTLAFLIIIAFANLPIASICSLYLIVSFCVSSTILCFFMIFPVFLFMQNLEQSPLTLASTVIYSTHSFVKLLTTTLHYGVHLGIYCLISRLILQLICTVILTSASRLNSSPPAPPTPPPISTYIGYTLCAIISFASFAIALIG